VIVGEAEVAAQSAAVKALHPAAATAAFAEQRIVPLAQLAERLVEALEVDVS
jgi:histidyl-tRNA synthetase